MPSNALYTNAQIREIEAYVKHHQIYAPYEMMQAAGSAAFKALREEWPKAKKIQIFCGKGNNGGDGYVVARLAKEAGLEVQVFAIQSPHQMQGPAREAAEKALEKGLQVKVAESIEDFEPGDVLVDALLGSGLRDKVEEPYASWIAAINKANKPVLALDVPSGISVDTGAALGSAIEAALTITFIGLKQGLFTANAPAHCGKISLDTLNIPNSVFAKFSHHAELLQWERLKELLPKRRLDAHKGHYGHVLVIGGDYGMGGAIRMASEAAMRVGAGLVSVATRPEHVSVVNCMRPEIMCHKVTSAGDLESLFSRATVIVIGPGLGQSEWSKSLFNRVLSTDHNKVLDADALNLLSQSPLQNDNWVLTPHPGEGSRLLHNTVQEIQSDRFLSAKMIQKNYGGVVVLKGVGTLIQGEGQPCKISQQGNPGMASGGMGDVLSGVIGGFLAQGLSPQDAAELGVWVHSMAADRAAAKGGERGLLACDLMDHLRAIVNPDD